MQGSLVWENAGLFSLRECRSLYFERMEDHSSSCRHTTWRMSTLFCPEENAGLFWENAGLFWENAGLFRLREWRTAPPRVDIQRGVCRHEKEQTTWGGATLWCLGENAGLFWENAGLFGENAGLFWEITVKPAADHHEGEQATVQHQVVCKGHLDLGPRDMLVGGSGPLVSTGRVTTFDFRSPKRCGARSLQLHAWGGEKGNTGMCRVSQRDKGDRYVYI